MNFKKVAATAMCAVCCLSNVVPAFAWTDGKAGAAPSADDRASITIVGVDEGATVTAYQVVEAKYNKYGVYRYQQTDETKAIHEIKDMENITDLDVTDIAIELYGDNNPVKDSDIVRLEYDKSTGNYFTKNAEAGSYIVIVETSNKEYIYNPMFVSNAYADANDASTLGTFVDVSGAQSNGSVDITLDEETGVSAVGNTMIDTSSTANASGLVSTRAGVAYAKKSSLPFDKAIVDASTHETDVEDVAIGDVVTFEVTTKIPDYSQAFIDENLTFKITDTQSEGLSDVTLSNIDTVATYTVDEDGNRTETVIPEDCYLFTFTGNDWVMEFTKGAGTAFLRNHPMHDVVIRYHATVTEDAVFATDVNTNKAELDYSTLPNTETGHKEDQVQLYTFKFKALKVNEEGAVTTVDGDIEAVSGALEGATFELRKLSDRNGELSDADKATYTYQSTSGEDGAFVFAGLDEGTYEMQEIDAPDGYFLNPALFTVDIAATYDDEGEFIKKYTLTISNQDTGETVQSEYFLDPDVEDTVNGMGIVNIHLTKLPSTGGEGAKWFTVIGGMLFIGGAAIVFVPRRKKQPVNA